MISIQCAIFKRYRKEIKKNRTPLFTPTKPPKALLLQLKPPGYPDTISPFPFLPFREKPIAQIW